jgi:hypothetical protein
MKNSFLKFDGNIVEVTFKFDVKESDSSYVHEFDYDVFQKIMREALFQRIKHCRKVLINEILEQDDVMMIHDGQILCSNKAQKHFSRKAYERMGTLCTILANCKSFKDLADRINRYDVSQMFKALSFAKFTTVEEDVLRECADVLGEYVCVL